MLPNRLRIGGIALVVLAMSIWSVPLLLAQDKDVTTKATSAKAVSPNDVSAKDVSAKDVSAKDVSAKDVSAKDEVEEAEPDRQYHNERIRGQVVWLADALEDRFGISTVPEAQDRVLAIATDDGKLLPLVENLRGRAFRKDERLRDRPMEIWVRRYQDQPLVQVLRIFEVAEEEMLEVDYWCDVCAIVMFETGPCSCCQDHNRLRKREVDPGDLKFTE